MELITRNCTLPSTELFVRSGCGWTPQPGVTDTKTSSRDFIAPGSKGWAESCRLLVVERCFSSMEQSLFQALLTLHFTVSFEVDAAGHRSPASLTRKQVVATLSPPALRPERSRAEFVRLLKVWDKAFFIWSSSNLTFYSFVWSGCGWTPQPGVVDTKTSSRGFVASGSKGWAESCSCSWTLL